jgi:hypothetical protein
MQAQQSNGARKGPIRLEPGQDVASIVRAAPAGSTFTFAAGLYRMQSIVPKDDDVFIGDGAAILNGSQVLELHPSDGLWSASAPKFAPPTGLTHCAIEHPSCWILNDLFIDDRLQRPVETLAELGPGKWYYDEESGTVSINTDPAGHKVEFSVLPAAFSGPAIGVRISHLVVEKYASPPQNGAVGGNLHAVVEAERSTGKPQSWTVDHTETRWNHGGGIGVGSDGHVDSCFIHDNGQIGLVGLGVDLVITNNEISFNNYAGYKKDWEAGGTKFALTDKLVVRSNYVHNNFGNGLWTDIDNTHALYEKNRVIDNQGIGIVHEISYDAIIRNNLVKGNKEGILAVLSPNVEIYGNVVEVPANGTQGIRIATGRRGSGKFGAYLAHDDYVHNNMVTYLGPAGSSGVSGPLISGANIRSDFNEFHVPAGGENHWLLGNNLPLSQARDAGIEAHSKVTKSAAPPADPTQTPDVQ